MTNPVAKKKTHKSGASSGMQSLENRVAPIAFGGGAASLLGAQSDFKAAPSPDVQPQGEFAGDGKEQLAELTEKQQLRLQAAMERDAQDDLKRVMGEVDETNRAQAGEKVPGPEADSSGGDSGSSKVKPPK